MPWPSPGGVGACAAACPRVAMTGPQPQRREQLRYSTITHADAWTARYSSLSSLRGTALYLSDLQDPPTGTATSHMGDRLHRAGRAPRRAHGHAHVPRSRSRSRSDTQSRISDRIIQLCTAVPWYATKLEGPTRDCLYAATAYCACYEPTTSPASFQMCISTLKAPRRRAPCIDPKAVHGPSRRLRAPHSRTKPAHARPCISRMLARPSAPSTLCGEPTPSRRPHPRALRVERDVERAG